MQSLDAWRQGGGWKRSMYTSLEPPRSLPAARTTKLMALPTGQSGFVEPKMYTSGNPSFDISHFASWRLHKSILSWEKYLWILKHCNVWCYPKFGLHEHWDWCRHIQWLKQGENTPIPDQWGDITRLKFPWRWLGRIIVVARGGQPLVLRISPASYCLPLLMWWG